VTSVTSNCDEYHGRGHRPHRSPPPGSLKSRVLGTGTWARAGSQPIGLPWQTVTAFVRIMTNARLPGERFALAEALEVVSSWLEQPNTRPLAAGEGHWPLFRQMLMEGQASGPLASHAHLAALTIEYGGVLHTTDRDFARFPGLRWKNPLA
jgi:uncharacterized protein